MSKPKIVFLDEQTIGRNVSLQSIKILGEYTSYPNTPKDMTIERIKGADIVITNKVYIGKAEIDAAPNLKLICIAATGTNGVNLEYAAQKGIPVKNAVNYSTESVAQTTFMQVLQIVGRSREYDEFVKNGDYSKSGCFTNVTLPWFELKGKTYGIIGLGNIGNRVAQIAEAFAMKIIYYPTSGKAHNDRYAAETDLNKFLPLCDVVSIHCPLNERTDNLLRLEQLKMMKPSAILVNMGRGGIVNESDLAQALDEGIIAAAASDVYTKEPLPANHPYLKMAHRERLFLTPHTAWASIEAQNTLVEKIAENIRQTKIPTSDRHKDGI